METKKINKRLREKEDPAPEKKNKVQSINPTPEERNEVNLIEGEDPLTIFEDGDKHTQRGNQKYLITLFIDDREICPGVATYLLLRAKRNNINLEIRTKRLVIGDFLYTADIHAVALCERKRIDDFFASVFDTRYAEQKARMKQTGIPLQSFVFTRTADERVSRDELYNMVFGGAEGEGVNNIKKYIDDHYHIIPRHARYNKEKKEMIPLSDDELQGYYTAIAKNHGVELVSDRFLPQYLYGVLMSVVEYIKVKDPTELPSHLFIEQTMGKKKITTPSLFLQAALQTFCSSATAAFLSTKYESISQLQDELRKTTDKQYLHKKYGKLVGPKPSERIYEFLLA